jgi:hypothetical protein
MMLVGLLSALPAVLVLAQESKPAQGGASPAGESTPETHVVPYCIEAMDSMPEQLRGLIEPQFRCEPGTHLKRDSRPVRVIPSGEEALGRPFVLRFDKPDQANAWYVRGFTEEPKK